MLFRAVFWFSLVVMLVPVKNDRMDPDRQGVSNVEALMFVQSVAGDLSAFCQRNPGSCETAGVLARNFSARVQAHAEELGEFISERRGSEQPDTMTTGSVKTK